MADREGTRKTAEAIVVSTTPDVCNTPAGSAMVPVPYPIIGRFDAVTGEVPTVLFTKQEAFTTASRITTVQGDEAGSGGGVGSGVNTGYCRPATYSSTVFAQGHQVVSHDCKMEMNCAGTDGPGNTQGQVIYLQVEMTVKLDETGEVVGETNPEVAPETPEEQSLWQKASPWVHGILDFGGLVPVFGEALDGVNALIYLGEGDKLNAGLSAAGMIPIAGWGATATKVGIKAEKLIVKEMIEEGAEKLTKEVIEEGAEKASKEVVEEGTEQAVKEGTEAGVKVTRKRLVVSEKRRKHILDGDETGGGHGPGRGTPGKSEFPSSLSDEDVIIGVENIANNPANYRGGVIPASGNHLVQGTIQGVPTTVVVRPGGEGIITAWPTNVPRNP